MHPSNRRSNHLRFLASLVAAGLLPLCAAHHLHAQTAYTWAGGTGNWSTDALWSTDTHLDSAAADVFIDGGQTGTTSAVNLAGSYTVGRLTLDAGDSLNVYGDQTFTVAAGGFSGSSTLVNNGTVNLVSQGGGHYSNLHFAGPGTLAGPGTIHLAGSQTIITASNAGDRLTIGRSAAIAGTGNVGDGRTTFTNNGAVNANVSGGTLTIQPGGGTADFTNNDSLCASNGGTIQS